FNPNFSLESQGSEKLLWDRELVHSAWKKSKEDNEYKFSSYEEIFLGHTPTQNFQSDLPLNFCNVWDLDTGAGWAGPLTIMNIQTKEFWQSEPTSKLY